MVSRSMTSTGDELPKSEVRAMREPVTTTVSFSSSSVCCDRAGTDRVVASAVPMTSREALEMNVWMFMGVSLLENHSCCLLMRSRNSCEL
jgi:hypothetical protein